ncbi:uncharacterized protein LOC110037503 isoform X2 [Phalaenopsis equestris]|uniref:uncharacterized protein LOC110032488 isoform X2 n=1 Tax=Phalaenopsis equestris TaxID=78828 RepID=UPI0009E358E5|nr:uncharacterized protein LOC110032488 isoform X2 [Phalaenopsis equestris]XP_020597822.1 uncharacterized protein LOC110037503 isoform X2 [Phalaenopsis equestris]
MVQAAVSFPCNLKFVLQPKTSYLPSSSFVIPTRNRRSKSRVPANLGGDGEIKRPEKKFITREEEPEHADIGRQRARRKERIQ